MMTMRSNMGNVNVCNVRGTGNEDATRLENSSAASPDDNDDDDDEDHEEEGDENRDDDSVV